MTKREYGNDYDKVVTVRLSKDLIEKLKKTSNVSMAKQIRKALEMYLK